ncbi:hypothetical protein GM708_09845 [Vibrio cholerae]|nr:hypothetical protein [Vibrio cholerae]
MKNTAPRTTKLSLRAVLSGAALALMLTACTTTAPTADTQDTPQTTQAPQAADMAEAEGTAEVEDVSDATEPAQAPTATVQTVFPDLAAPDGEPELESITTASPAPGEILHAAGPFDQRLVLEDLAFDGSTVSGEVLVTSDISSLLALQVLAGFYDKEGTLLGTGRFDHHPGSEHTHGGPSEPEAFEITVPAEFADQAVSAAVGVPVLVNE